MKLINYRKPLNRASLFIIGYHIFLLLTLPWYFMNFNLHTSTAIMGVIFLYLSGLGITGGYHRLFSHRSYKTHPIIEGIILFFASSSAQGSALRWSYDHRIHHAHVDTDQDPYSIKKGFWYAHCLWLLDSPKPIDPKVVPDLMNNKLVMFQHNRYRSCFVLSNVILFITSGLICSDWWGAFFISFWLRLFLLHHFTWFINSLAHTWGDKPFCQEQTAVNNFIISLLTFGEGYHNYHHTFANDYRNGVRWYHFDPTKWLIWTLHQLGLATGLKVMDPYTIQKRMVTERKNLLLNRIKDVWYIKKDELEVKIEEISQRIVDRIAEYRALHEQYLKCKREKIERDVLKEIAAELRNLRRKINSDRYAWRELSLNIMSLRPITA